MIRLGMTAVVALIAACATMSAGAGDGASQASVTVAAAPHIDRIVPDTVSAAPGTVVEVSIVGRGFVPGRPGMNTIDFAGMSITSVPSNSAGTEIRFAVPNEIRSTGEAPPMPIHPGSFTVRVRTDRGTSNSVSLMVTP